MKLILHDGTNPLSEGSWSRLHEQKIFITCTNHCTSYDISTLNFFHPIMSSCTSSSRLISVGPEQRQLCLQWWLMGLYHIQQWIFVLHYHTWSLCVRMARAKTKEMFWRDTPRLLVAWKYDFRCLILIWWPWHFAVSVKICIYMSNQTSDHTLLSVFQLDNTRRIHICICITYTYYILHTFFFLRSLWGCHVSKSFSHQSCVGSAHSSTPTQYQSARVQQWVTSVGCRRG